MWQKYSCSPSEFMSKLLQLHFIFLKRQDFQHFFLQVRDFSIVCWRSCSSSLWHWRADLSVSCSWLSPRLPSLFPLWSHGSHSSAPGLSSSVVSFRLFRVAEKKKRKHYFIFKAMLKPCCCCYMLLTCNLITSHQLNIILKPWSQNKMSFFVLDWCHQSNLLTVCPG